MLGLILQWFITVPCAIYGAYVSCFNLWVLRSSIRARPSPSPIYCVGGCAGVVCLVVCPEPGLVGIWLTMISVDGLLCLGTLALVLVEWYKAR